MEMFYRILFQLYINAIFPDNNEITINEDLTTKDTHIYKCIIK